MHTKKFMLYASVVMLVSAISVTGQAADKQENKSKDTNQAKTKPKVEAKLPIVIEADNLSFSDLTGDLFADGNVVFKRDQETILTDHMHGNAKQTEVWMEDQATLEQPGTKLVGTDTHYNYTTRVGDMDMAKGKVGHQYISGDNITFSPTKLTAYNGTMTKCPAVVPDYHMSAERVEIWPGEKMIAYNAKFWIGKTVLYSVSEYETSLVPNEGKSAFPRVGYNSDDGVYLRQYLEYPIAGNVVAFTDLGYYSKSGFKPEYGIIDREKNYTVQVIQGEYQDSDNAWIKKEPELRFDLHRKRLGTLPVSYTFSAIYGKWTDSTKSSWHQDYNLYFNHDTITLNKNLFLSMGTGIERIRESYDGSNRNVLKFDTTLTKVWSPRFSTIAEYHYTKNNVSLFNYDATDMAREADLGFTYKIDNMNTVGFRQSYDLNTNKVYDTDYTWYRNLHCWQAQIVYRAKRQELNFALTTTRW